MDTKALEEAITDVGGQACNMHKCIYTNDKVHIHIQMKAANIYMGSIYMNTRLGLGVYSPYICIYSDIETCTQIGANIYIYIYTHA